MTVTIDYLGAQLRVPDFLVDLWPHEMEWKQWPTFCGAGDGLGDWIVPDRVRGAILAPACFIHDVEWAIAGDRGVYAFLMANLHLTINNRQCVSVQIPNTEKVRKRMALHLCNLYGAMVCTPFGWRNFHPCGTVAWEKNLTVQDKLRRLARANLGLVS